MNSEAFVGSAPLALPMADENSVLPKARRERATIYKVDADSPAGDAGVKPGDLLTHVNDQPVLDIVDFAFLTAGEDISITVYREGAGDVRFSFQKGYDEDLGIEFSDDLFDRVHICKNKCVFCFLYQQPKGLRPTLYIKDDDYRLSFLHGNYLTLTNMGEDEFTRVIEQKLSPLYVSVHATDPEVRGRMLGRKGPEGILPRLEMLAAAKIQIHAQIVLCPGYNDGEVLKQSIRELALLHPDVQGRFGGVLSVAIVPVGLTQFRDRLAALTTCDTDFCKGIIEDVDVFRAKYKKSLGTNFAFLSDEFYLSAGVPVPPATQYEGFPQLEDGVGMVRLFIDDLQKWRKKRPAKANTPRTATLVTGELAGPLVTELAQSLSEVEGVDVNVCIVHNTFFEGNISVAGLLTGKDIVDALQNMGDSVGERVILPAVMLRDPDRDIFLDDMTLTTFGNTLGRDVMIVERTPSAAAAAVLG
jgi:putative radical SAM enzyme (TIGR03279 family)